MHGTHRRAHTPLIALRDGSTPGAAGAAWPLRPATSPSILPAAFSLGPLSLPGSRARPCTRATYGRCRFSAAHTPAPFIPLAPLAAAHWEGRRYPHHACGWLMPMTVLSSSRSATDWAVGEEAAAELAWYMR